MRSTDMHRLTIGEQMFDDLNPVHFHVAAPRKIFQRKPGPSERNFGLTPGDACDLDVTDCI